MSATKSVLAYAAGTSTLLLVLFGLLLLGDYPATAATQALWNGSVGSWYALTSATLVRAVPLMLTGCAVAVAFRAGVFNIGAEGQLLAGAAAAAAVALAMPHSGLLATGVALVAGVVAGASWAAIAAILRSRFGVLEVISTIMLNFVALHAVSYLVRGPLQEPSHSYPQTSSIAENIQLGRIPGAGRLHTGVLLAGSVLVLGGWLFRHTAAGFRLLAVGENASAAESAGQIDVVRVTSPACDTSGALAGLAGAIEVLGVTYALYENISPGYGYTAIAVALLAGLDPWRILLSATFFGALEAGGGAMQRDVGIPSTLVSVIESLIILTVIGILALQHHTRPAAASVVVTSAGS